MRNKKSKSKSLKESDLSVYSLKVGRFDVLPGKLYMETKSHYVFINNMAPNIDLGPLKNVKSEHIDPECSVKVFPKRAIKKIIKT